MVCKYRVVLSIDGGGARGIVPLRILSFLQDAIKSIEADLDIPAWVDVFSGTSTSSIISGALMLKDEKDKALHDPKSMLNLYLHRGHQIFTRNNGIDPQNSFYPLSFVLEHFFGRITLEQIRKHFLFVSYDLNSEQQFIFTDTIDRFRSLSLAKMMNACSAYPGIFPPLKLESSLLADGMLSTKNPSMLAYEYARVFYPTDPIILISLGTGYQSMAQQDYNEMEVQKIHEELDRTARTDDRLIYFRFQPELVQSVENMDDATPENMLNLLDDTDNYLEQERARVNRLMSLMRIRAEQQFV